MKNFLQKLLFFFLLLSVISCEKKNFNLFAVISFRVVNAQGENLLNTTYNKSNINVYYVENGQAILFQRPLYDADKGFKLYDETIVVYLNHIQRERNPLTLIKFGDSKIDTIKTKFKYTNRSTVLEKVWYNGKSQPKAEVFTVVK